MTKIIGIRREDKNKWERRVPLIPAHVGDLKETHGIATIVQPSDIRIFSDQEYRTAGAEIRENLSEAAVIFAVKEIPIHLIEEGKTYVFFSHTIKGQPYNMEMLRRLMDLNCNLVDYERMSDHGNARLITFSFYAGIAGMIETLHAFGRKMALQGHRTPFETIQQAYQYNSETVAREEIRKLGQEISQNGVPDALHPLTIGLSGYGNVSKGAQAILDLLPQKTITPDQLKAGLNSTELDNTCLYKIVFKENDMVRPMDGEFELQDYYSHPEKYQSRFDDYLPGLKVLVNCVYWTEQYPRIISVESLGRLAAGVNAPALQVIGDISCDIKGSIEITRAATKPDNACYTYYPDGNAYKDGIHGPGITVMAIDNLPCEFPGEASTSFSSELKRFVNTIASADFSKDFEQLNLPAEIKKAVILQNGTLTPYYQYMAAFI
jgi:saccharopine dehydrogenase (NAD+, L-lysine-forming)